MTDEPLDEIEKWIADCLAKTPEPGWTTALQRLCDEHPETPELRARVAAITRMLQLRSGPGSLHHTGYDSTGAVFGGYRIGRLLGSGGMGVVHVAEQTATKRSVALKRLRPEFLGSERLRQRFRREVELAASLDHPNICTIYEAGEVDGVPFLAMQLVDGEPLDRVIAARGPITPRDLPDALDLLARIGFALHHAHERGLVHRDVKPSNVLCRAADREPLVLDFGLARPSDVGADEVLTVSGEIVGTPAYVAPEQIDGSSRRSHDHLVDVYALGVTAYECLTGALPFEGPTRAALYRKILDASPPRVSARLPFVSRDLDVVVATAMAREPRRRYATAALLAEDLRRVREGRPIVARRSPVLVRAARWARRYPVVAGLIAMLLVVSVAATGYAWLAAIRLEERRHATLLAAARGATSHELGLVLARAAASESPGFEELSVLRRQLQGAQWRVRLPPRAPSGHLPIVVDGSGRVWAAAAEPLACCWHPERGAIPIELPQPANWLALSPDGSTVAFACGDHGVLLVAAEAPDASGTQRWRTAEGLTGARVVEFTRDDRLVVGDAAGAIWLDEPGGLRRVPTPDGWQIGEATCMVRHPVTGDVLMGTTSREGGTLVRMTPGSMPEQLCAFPNQVWQIQCSPDSPRFLALHVGCTVWSSDPASPGTAPRMVLRIAAHGTVSGAGFYGDDVLTGHLDACIRVWRVPDRPPEAPAPAEVWRGHIGWVSRLACDVPSRRVVSVDARGLTLVWDRATGRTLTSFEAASRWPTAVGFVGASAIYVRMRGAAMLGVVDLPTHAAGSRHTLRDVPLALATSGGVAVIATPQGWLQRLEGSPPRVSERHLHGVASSIAIRADGSTVCCFLLDQPKSERRFAYFDQDLQPVGTCSFRCGTGDFLPLVAWRPDGAALATADLRDPNGVRSIPSWVATRRTEGGGWEPAEVAPGLPDAAGVTALTFLADGRLAVGFEDRVAIFALAGPADSARWSEAGSRDLPGRVPTQLHAVAGKVLVGTTLGAVLLWSPATDDLRELPGLKHDAVPIPSADGRHLLSVGARNIVVATIDGQRLYQIERVGEEQFTVAGFLDDGRLVVAGTQCTLETWALDPQEILTRASQLQASLPTYAEVAPYLDLLPASERERLERQLHVETAPVDRVPK